MDFRLNRLRILVKFKVKTIKRKSVGKKVGCKNTVLQRVILRKKRPLGKRFLGDRSFE